MSTDSTTASVLHASWDFITVDPDRRSAGCTTRFTAYMPT